MASSKATTENTVIYTYNTRVWPLLDLGGHFCVSHVEISYVHRGGWGKRHPTNTMIRASPVNHFCPGQVAMDNCAGTWHLHNNKAHYVDGAWNGNINPQYCSSDGSSDVELDYFGRPMCGGGQLGWEYYMEAGDVRGEDCIAGQCGLTYTVPLTFDYAQHGPVRYLVVHEQVRPAWHVGAAARLISSPRSARPPCPRP